MTQPMQTAGKDEGSDEADLSFGSQRPRAAAAGPVAYRTTFASSRVLSADTLAVVCFGEPAPGSDPRLCTVPLAPLAELPSLTEIWQAAGPVATGRSDAVSYACDEHVLFAWTSVDEAALGHDIAGASEAAYAMLFAACDALGMRWPFRVWNYLSDINGIDESTGRERYQLFCDGRKRALRQARRDGETVLPAASAIGCARSGGLLLCALAAREPGLQVENPRQVSAFRYPLRYGPSSPSFSRSMLQSWGDGGRHLYVSGTASIVGHASMHDDACDAQLDETLDNLDALLRHAGERTGAAYAFNGLKVYLRHADAAARVGTRIAARVGIGVPLLLLQGDICRKELVLEVEGVAVAASG